MILGDLSDSSSQRILKHCRSNSLAISFYLAPRLIDWCLKVDPLDSSKNLEFVCKNIAIQVSVNSVTSKDLEMKVELLIALLATRKSEIFVIELLEDQLINTHKKNQFSIDKVERLFKAYSQSIVKGANYTLLDVISADLLKSIDTLEISQIRRILLSLKQLKYTNASLLNALNRRIFSLINSPKNAAALTGHTEKPVDPEKSDSQEMVSQVAPSKFSTQQEIEELSECLYALLYLEVILNALL